MFIFYRKRKVVKVNFFFCILNEVWPNDRTCSADVLLASLKVCIKLDVRVRNKRKPVWVFTRICYLAVNVGFLSSALFLLLHRRISEIWMFRCSFFFFFAISYFWDSLHNNVLHFKKKTLCLQVLDIKRVNWLIPVQPCLERCSVVSLPMQLLTNRCFITLFLKHHWSDERRLYVV